MVMLTQHEAWRRPITAHAEETYDYYSGAPERSIMWFLHGKHQEDDALRLARGEACGVCLTTFPAKPAMENLQAWRPYIREWVNPIRTADDVTKLIAQGRCPTCASEVRDEMHELLHRGVDPLRPKGMDA